MNEEDPIAGHEELLRHIQGNYGCLTITEKQVMENGSRKDYCVQDSGRRTACSHIPQVTSCEILAP